jgi:hypothetical protein
LLQEIGAKRPNRDRNMALISTEDDEGTDYLFDFKRIFNEIKKRIRDKKYSKEALGVFS